MGTNYYAIPLLTEDQKKEIIEAVNADDYGTIQKLIPEKIHIGKSSAGWKFAFNSNYWKYFPMGDIEAMKSFYRSCSIMDEYGRKQNFDELWEYIQSTQDKKTHDDGETICGYDFIDGEFS